MWSSHPKTRRLDQKHKELTRQKEELLKESKAKLATMDNVKAQIDSLIKVCGLLAASLHTASSQWYADCHRGAKEG